MRQILQLACIVAVALAVCGSVQAQRLRTSGVTVLPSGDSALGLTFPVPGLGFDFVHHAAVNRNTAARALIDPITQHQIALERELLRDRARFFPTGPVLINSTQIVIVQQPPVVIVQQPVAREEPEGRVVERVRYVEREPEPRPEHFPQAAAPRFPEPTHEASDLVLVRRDGSLIFAIAWVRQGERLVYVTREGLRRHVPFSEIDVEATQQINESRGTLLLLAP